jgi:hypothetical protein
LSGHPRSSFWGWRAGPFLTRRSSDNVSSVQRRAGAWWLCTFDPEAALTGSFQVADSSLRFAMLFRRHGPETTAPPHAPPPTELCDRQCCAGRRAGACVDQFPAWGRLGGGIAMPGGRGPGCQAGRGSSHGVVRSVNDALYNELFMAAVRCGFVAISGRGALAGPSMRSCSAHCAEPLHGP